ncbi:MAG: putative metal-binding motif-containing protein, partial [Myxococcota bacterium]|nr:putative metal-binding motif-containing protein [Myxococcota bacterium]
MRWSIVLSTILFTGCERGFKEVNLDSGSEEVVDTGVEIVDADGDGYGEEVDCDDEDASINPGATEACDGVDNDCSGEIDDAVGDIWYEDADEDGYGDAD